MQQPCTRTAMLIMILIWASGLSPGWAVESIVEIDLAKGIETPINPTVNVWGNHTVVLRVVGLPNGIQPEKVEIRMGILDLTGESPKPEIVFNGTSASIHLLPCSDFGMSRREETQAREAQERASGLPDCGFATKGGDHVATIYSSDRGVAISVLRVLEGGGRSVLRQLTLQLESKPWFIDWSAGFSFLKTSNHRFRLDVAEGHQDRATIRRVDPEPWEYEFASYVHYFPYAWRGIGGFSVGVSTGVPTESLSIGLGIDLRLRTFGDSSNAAYLTIGAAFAKRDRLHHDFIGRTEVPADLSADQLVESEYGVTPFVAITFGFWGGKSFQGVYPGD